MKSKISPTPWKLGQDLDIYSEGHPIFYFMDGYAPKKENAEAAITAVNATYGNGINPEAVKDLLEVAKLFLFDLEDLKKYDSLSKAGEQWLKRTKEAIELAKTI